MKRALIVLALSFVSTVSLAASEVMEEKYTFQPHYESAAKALGLGMVDSHLAASCLIQTDSTGRNFIANDAECFKAVTELKEAFKGQLMEQEVNDRIEEFVGLYLIGT